MQETGSGYEALAAFCNIMNMLCLSEPAYFKQVDNIVEAFEDNTLDTAVSFDGT